MFIFFKIIIFNFTGLFEVENESSIVYVSFLVKKRKNKTKIRLSLPMPYKFLVVGRIVSNCYFLHI